MVGIERTVLPLVARVDFGIASASAATAFIVTFGVSKALLNLAAGGLADRYGRRRLLLLGWAVGLPVPALLMFAPAWPWVLAANVLLGVNQSLAWSMTVVMKVDLVRPSLYGRVIGWNEFAGYAGMSATAVGTGLVAARWGLRPEPFVLGVVVALLGLLLSLGARETAPARAARVARDETARSVPFVRVLAEGTFARLPLGAASAAGLATNLKDGALWGLLPLLLTARALPIEQVGLVAALYPAVWAFSQLVFGPLSDRVGRGGLIVGGLATQAGGVSVFVFGGGLAAAVLAALLVGLGTGMVYPTLLAFVAEEVPADVRASALGVYRFWRDAGYAVGALGAGVLADRTGIPTALVAVSAVLLAAAAFAALGLRNAGGPGGAAAAGGAPT